MRSRTWLAATLLIAGLGLTLDAAAQDQGGARKGGEEASNAEPSDSSEDARAESQASSKYKTVKMGKVQEFRPIWRSVRDIQGNITSFEDALNQTRNGLKDAAGIARNQPLKHAFDTIRKRSGGGLQVEQGEDGLPRVSGSGLAEDIAGFVLAANDAVAACASIVQGAKAFPDQLTTLFTEVQALPGKLNANMLQANGLTENDLGAQLTVIAHNGEAIVETKDRVAAVIDGAKKVIGFVADLAPNKK